MLHIVTILDLIKQGTLRYNVKFMIEGDEETGSPYLEKFLHDHKELLACDAVMVSDGEIIGDHTPTIGAGFR
jgi:acetylornithine deacetylase/succinyl-diaminopimelate desuccinylase-like protein